MLGKLIKHEFKATARLLLPIYLLLVVLTIMNRITLSLHFRGTLEVYAALLALAYAATLSAIVIVTFVINIQRFYKNLLSDEGYLMFTLPVNQRDLINSKLIVSFIWNLTSGVAVLLSLFAVFINSERIIQLRDEFHEFWDFMQDGFGTGDATLFIIEMIALIVIAILSGNLLIYTSIAIGQLWNGHRVLGSFAAYICISTILQIVFTTFAVILGRIPINTDEITVLTRTFFPIFIVFGVVIAILFYWLTNFLFKRKLNLE